MVNPNIYLYKLHGSINWRRDEKRNLIHLPHTEKIKPEEMEIIFGRDFKLEAADPYLFYAYEFRRCSFESTLLITAKLSDKLKSAVSEEISQIASVSLICSTQ